MNESPEVRRSSLHAVVLTAPFVGLALLAVLRFATTPDPRGYGTHEQLGFSPCGFREWFDGPCPTCGMTTSASHVVRGEIAQAWSVQPFSVLAALVTVVAAFAFVALHRRGADLGVLAVRHGAAFWAGVAVLVGICWVV